jgi:probable F420-dependent oxidoreductase
VRDGLAIAVTFTGLSRLFGEDLAGLLETAAEADRAGVDQLVVTDHLAMGLRIDRYPYGRFPMPEHEPWPEPLALLGAMAASTERARLATGVLIAPLRPALELAKAAATVDVLSRGRLDLGVGVGWQREEFDAAGVAFEGRAARMDDQLRACRALWSGERVSFESPTVRFDDLLSLPRPVQRGGPPLWFGVAATPRNAERVAELGHGWAPIGTDLAAFTEGVDVLRRAFERAGRDPATLAVRAHAPVETDAAGRPDLERTLAALPRLRAAGVTHAAFALPVFARSRAELPGLFARLRERP